MTMNPEELPVIGAVFRFGAQDRVLDSILILGPLVVVFFAVLGRSILTETVVALYVLCSSSTCRTSLSPGTPTPSESGHPSPLSALVPTPVPASSTSPRDG